MGTHVRRDTILLSAASQRTASSPVRIQRYRRGIPSASLLTNVDVLVPQDCGVALLHPEVTLETELVPAGFRQ